MSDEAYQKFQEKLQLLTVAFSESLPGKINAMESMLNDLIKQWDIQVLQDLHRASHNLVGSSKTFGFPHLSTQARVLEQILNHLMSKNVPADNEQIAEITQQIIELKKIHSEIESVSSENSTPVALITDDNNDLSRYLSSPILLVEDDANAAEELALQLRYYGYSVEIFNRPNNQFRTALKKKPNAIILMDIKFPDDALGGIRIMQEIQQELKQHPARVIFISAHTDLEHRLGAVRSGSIAYFTKPINPTELIDWLDSISGVQQQEPFRILIVDDSPSTLFYHSAILEQIGMEVVGVVEPMKIMEVFPEFIPDLILMDLYMPTCNGIELAKIVRQMHNFSSIPIVYLSAESDFTTQIEAMSLGGDDFLVKPIKPEHLISSVTIRVLRSRYLHKLMIHDGLTGLLNHTATKEALSREAARSSRLGAPLSFAMLDIDFFKKVNDTYGHPAGDRVIKSLARLLKQRLRKTDIIGRYGGEEFAIIMSDTDVTTAARVMDEIRLAFSGLTHHSLDKEFSASFSCGIADLAHFPEVPQLNEAADKALYKAKQRGRNKVVISCPERNLI